jgi:hypothetical protein
MKFVAFVAFSFDSALTCLLCDKRYYRNFLLLLRVYYTFSICGICGIYGCENWFFFLKKKKNYCTSSHKTFLVIIKDKMKFKQYRLQILVNGMPLEECWEPLDNDDDKFSSYARDKITKLKYERQV